MTDMSAWVGVHRVLCGAIAVSLTVAAMLAADQAQAAPRNTAASKSSWTIGFGSIGPVTTKMTVAGAIRTLHSRVSSKPHDPYCGLFGLTGDLPTGLAGFAPKKGGPLGMLSIGADLGGTSKGLPKVVQTKEGVRLGTSLQRLQSAYPLQLHELKDRYYKTEILRGPHGLAIAFELSKGKVVNISTGTAKLLVLYEYCG